MECQCCNDNDKKGKSHFQKKILKCPGKDCTYAACRQCHEIYFEISGLKCMGCAMPYTPEHFTKMGLPKNWLRNDYFKHLVTIAFVREEQMLPLSLQEATTRKAIESHRKEIREIIKQGNHADIRRPQKEYFDILMKFINETFDDFRGNSLHYDAFIMNDANATVFKGHHAFLREQYLALSRIAASKESQDAATQIQKLKQAIHTLEITLAKKSRVVYAAVHKCQTLDCRGFLDANFACGLCGVNFCKRCRTPFGEGHVCDEDTVKTIEEIARTARSCPKCAVPITRTEG